jgi:hypothetical protein
MTEKEGSAAWTTNVSDRSERQEADDEAATQALQLFLPK